MSRQNLTALEDILEAIEGIESAVTGKTFSDFQADWLLRRGVERGIEIISEASRRIPPEFKMIRPDVPWREIATIGNILRHEYHSIADVIVWNVVQGNLSPLKEAIRTILAQRGE